MAAMFIFRVLKIHFRVLKKRSTGQNSLHFSGSTAAYASPKNNSIF
jgi:hypothetical protein